MSVSIRVKSLHTGTRGSDSLSAAEAHGKRLDASSKARRISEREALVYGSLNLRQAYKKHIEGCRMNKGLKKSVQHALIHFPNTVKIDAVSEKKMLKLAVDFINETHGGDAVFAARLDRDEKGQHNVDVFFTPKYTKKTKTNGEELWISTTKFGKELCHKHKAEIEERSKRKFKTGPRQVGMALQSELREFMKGTIFAKHVREKKEKIDPKSDWKPVEAYQLDKVEDRIKAKDQEIEALKLKLQQSETKYQNLLNKLTSYVHETRHFLDTLSPKNMRFGNMVLSLAGLLPKEEPEKPRPDLEKKHDEDDDYSPPSFPR